MPRRFVSVAVAAGEQSVEATGDDCESQVGVDAHGDRGRQRIHVEEIDGLGDPVLDHHAACTAVDEFSRAGVAPVGSSSTGSSRPRDSGRMDTQT